MGFVLNTVFAVKEIENSSKEDDNDTDDLVGVDLVAEPEDRKNDRKDFSDSDDERDDMLPEFLNHVVDKELA